MVNFCVCMCVRNFRNYIFGLNNYSSIMKLGYLVRLVQLQVRFADEFFYDSQKLEN